MEDDNYSDKKFIEKSDNLIKKLENKQLWNKGTLVIGLDKSVRPLAYTLRKISQLERKDTPDMKFFNYSHFDYATDKKTSKKISSYMKNKIKPKALAKYENIIILDDYIATGKSMEGMHQVLEYYFANVRNKPEIVLAALGSTKDNFYKKKKNNPKGNPNLLTYEELGNDFTFMGRYKTGVEDKLLNYKPFLRKKQKITASQKVQNPNEYKKFLQNRRQLSKEINDYMAKDHITPDNTNISQLERAVQVVSITALLGGFIFGYNGMTGNVIGSVSSSNIFGSVLIILGILGLVFSRIRIRK